MPRLLEGRLVCLCLVFLNGWLEGLKVYFIINCKLWVDELYSAALEGLWEVYKLEGSPSIIVLGLNKRSLGVLKYLYSYWLFSRNFGSYFPCLFMSYVLEKLSLSFCLIAWLCLIIQDMIINSSCIVIVVLCRSVIQAVSCFDGSTHFVCIVTGPKAVMVVVPGYFHFVICICIHPNYCIVNACWPMSVLFNAGRVFLDFWPDCLTQK